MPMDAFKKIVRNIFVYAASILLRTLLIPISVMYAIIKLFITSHFDNAFIYIGDLFLVMAKSVDKYGNVVCAPLFNDTLITKTSQHRFGSQQETISEVIGYNLEAKTLTKTGTELNNFLNFLDKNHTLKAIGDNNVK
jgi:hypothetical protein